MRSYSLSRQLNIKGTTQFGMSFAGARKSNPDYLHQSPTNTGCICSDGKYHLCLHCPESDCNITFDTAKRRGTKV